MKLIVLIISLFLCLVCAAPTITNPVEKYGLPRSHYKNYTGETIEYRHGKKFTYSLDCVNDKCMYLTHIDRIEKQKRLYSTNVIIHFHSKTYLKFKDTPQDGGDEHYWTVNTKTHDVTDYRSTTYQLISDPFDVLGNDNVHLNADLRPKFPFEHLAIVVLQALIMFLMTLAIICIDKQLNVKMLRKHDKQIDIMKWIWILICLVILSEPHIVYRNDKKYIYDTVCSNGKCLYRTRTERIE
jgi:hypothetical protein